MELADGSRVSSFKEIARAGKEHFQNLFKKPSSANIEYMMKVVRTFPRCFDQEMNGELDIEVTRNELKDILHSFKKARSPGPDSWTVKFYLGLYEFLE